MLILIIKKVNIIYSFFANKNNSIKKRFIQFNMNRVETNKIIKKIRIIGLDDLIFYDYENELLKMINKLGDKVELSIGDKYKCSTAIATEISDNNKRGYITSPPLTNQCTNIDRELNTYSHPFKSVTTNDVYIRNIATATNAANKCKIYDFINKDSTSIIIFTNTSHETIPEYNH